MSRRINKLTQMDIDEVSLVDADANGHAKMLIAKRDESPEESMPDQDNDEVTFTDDDLVYDESGNAFLPVQMEDGEEAYAPIAQDTDGTYYVVDDDDEQDYDPDGEGAASDATEQVLAGLSKALGDSDRDEVVAKAYGEIAKLQKRTEQAEQVAKAERDLRLTREYVAKAAEYALPVPPETLGPVLKRCAEVLSKSDQLVLAQCFEAASNDMFTEIGKAGGGDNSDIMAQVNAFAEDTFAKNDVPISRESLIGKQFEMNPALYDQYLADRRGR
jgi:hypothetical protein